MTFSNAAGYVRKESKAGISTEAGLIAYNAAGFRGFYVRAEEGARVMGRFPESLPQELIDLLQAIARGMPPSPPMVSLARRLTVCLMRIAPRTGLTVREVGRHIARAMLLPDRRFHEPPRP